MNAYRRDEEAIFYAALEKKPGVERETYLKEACGSDAELLERVEVLLRAHEAEGNFLEVPSTEPDVTLDMSSEGLPGTKIGRYGLIQVIGEGGMGLVYLAQQQQPVKRQVALKIIKPGMDSKEVIARFEAERQALAVLDHPNIARVFDAGTTDKGRPYFVMEYVKGLPISRYCDEHKIDIEQRLKLFKDICEGVHHAHQKGIIHRDIKPSNILVSVHGDRAVPKIIDFGIAKAMASTLTEKTVVTYQGQLLGTPEYMSPEQVDMAVQDIDIRSDIYSLGIVLYELLAGALPFERASLQKLSFAELQRTLREQEPASPSTRLTGLGEEAKTIAASRDTHVVALAKRLHRELEWIPLKAMRKDRCRRYKSASEMADDVQNYLGGNPLIAGPETASYRVQKFVRKHAGSVATVALTAAAVILGLIVSTTMYLEAEDARKDEATERARAEEARTSEVIARDRAEKAERAALEKAEEYRWALYSGRIAAASAACRQDDALVAFEQLEVCPVDLRGWEWNHLRHKCDESVMTLKGRGDWLAGLALSPQGDTIASGGNDNAITLWDTNSGREILALSGHASEGLVLDFCPKGKRLVSGGYDGVLRVWDIDQRRVMASLKGHEAQIQFAGYGQDESKIFFADINGLVKTWKWTESNKSQTIFVRKCFLNDADISPNGSLMALCYADGVQKILDTETNQVLRTFYADGNNALAVALSTDGEYIASSNYEGVLEIWDIDEGSRILEVQTDLIQIDCLSFARGEDWVACGDEVGRIKLFDVATGREIMSFSGHRTTVTDILFGPQNKEMFSCGDDNTVRVWDLGRDDNILTLDGHPANVSAITFGQDSTHMASLDDEGNIIVWDVSSACEVSAICEISARNGSLALSPDCQHLAVGQVDGTVALWNILNSAKEMTIQCCEGPVSSVSFSPDGRFILAGARAGIVLADAMMGAEIRRFEAGYPTRFTHDGKRVVGRVGEYTIKTWDVKTGRELKSTTIDSAASTLDLFSTDCKRLAVGGEDVTEIWDVKEGIRLAAPAIGESGVHSLAFSPDGRRLAASEWYAHTVRIWDVETGTPVLITTMQGNDVGGIAFSPDGTTLAVGTGKSIRLLGSLAPSENYRRRRLGRMAKAKVESLYEKTGDYQEVLSQIRNDQDLDLDVSRKSLRIAEARQSIYVRKAKKSILDTLVSPESDVNEYAHALEQIEKINLFKPRNRELMTILGIALYKTGQYEKSFTALSSAVDTKTPTRQHLDVKNMAFTAMVLLRLGKPDEASAVLGQLRDFVASKEGFSIANADRRVRLCVFDMEILFADGQNRIESMWEAIRQGDYADAADLAAKLKKSSDPGATEAYRSALPWLKHAYENKTRRRFRVWPPYRADDWKDYVEDLEVSLQLDPNNFASLVNLARELSICIVNESRDPARAVEIARKACELSNWTNRGAISLLAIAYSELGDYDSAVAYEKKAISLLPKTTLQHQRDWHDAVLKHYEAGKPYNAGDSWSLSHGRLAASWDFDADPNEITSNVSGYHLPGKLIGDAHVVNDSRKGKVLRLDGESDYVDFGKDSTFSIIGSTTIAAWVKCESLDDKNRIILTKGKKSWHLTACGERDISTFSCGAFGRWGRRGVKAHARVDFRDSQWHHLAGVFDGRNVYLYVDGDVGGTAIAWGRVALDDGPLYVGGSESAPADGFRGLIDDVRIYSYALDADEVKMLYEGEEPPRKKEISK